MPTPYTALMLAGAGLGTLLFVLACRRAGMPLAGVIGLAAATAATGLLAGRAYVLFELGGDAGAGDLASGSFRLPGVVLGLLAGLVVWRPVFLPGGSLAQLGDLGAPAAAFGQACARLGCLAAGCCFGTVTHLPWGVHFPLGSLAADVHSTLGLLPSDAARTLPVHPLQIYFVLLHVGVGVALLAFQRRKAYHGQVLLVGLLLTHAGKAVLESLRQPIPGASTAHLQLVSTAIAAAAALALLAIQIRRARMTGSRLTLATRIPS